MHFIGFMNFGIKSEKACTRLNPFTKEKVKVPACKKPTVKLSASFKQLLKK
jgi:nucleoid DNA-binding protein